MATTHMTVGRVKPLVDRAGAESSAYQFVREAYQNSVEAGATAVKIMPELGATRIGVYRFLLVDDGRSMSSHELVSFVNKFGGGGKPIGDQHENYGIGLKTSTLPWNHHGVIVVARQGGETNLIRLQLDSSANEYGLRQWEVEDPYGEVEVLDYLPLARKEAGAWTPQVDRDFEPVDGTRVRDLLDAFIDDNHGTVVVLCGNASTDDTFLATGAGGQLAAGPISGTATYLSQRYDTLPVPVEVLELRSENRSEWPKSPDEISSGQMADATADWAIRVRHPMGLGDFLRSGSKRGTRVPEHQGTVELKDGTRAHWFLLSKDEAYDGGGAGNAYWKSSIAVRYRGEIYVWGSSQRQRFRQFGVTRANVIDRCTIVLEPPENNGGPGVYPDSSRSRLLWTGGKNLPWSDWAKMFQARMPDEIEQALADATAELTKLNPEDLNDVQQKRISKFAKRIAGSWRRLASAKDDPSAVSSTRVRSLGRVGGGGTETGGGGGGSGGGGSGQGSPERFIEDANGEERPTVEVKRPNELPMVRWVPKEEVDNPVLAALWQEAEFAIDANLECPIIRDSIDYWTSEYPSLDPDDIARSVQRVYGLKLQTVVAHMIAAKRKGRIKQDELEQALSPVALTAALAGFLVEDRALAGDLGALEGKRKAALKSS